jgi:hypothetical protein
MKYLVRSISEMSAAEVEQYICLYNKVFDKQLTIEGFYYKFSKQFGNASYFALMVDERSGIVGSVGAIAVPYVWRGQRLMFGLTVDGMIDEHHRGNFLALRRLHDLLTGELLKREIFFIFTKPNQNSYLYLKKMLGLTDLGTMNVYAFPLRIFRSMHRRLGWCDKLWLAAVGMIAPRRRAFRAVSLQTITDLGGRMPPELQRYACHPRDADFLQRRYGLPAYRHAASGDEFVVYRIARFARRCLCFVMEASPLTRSGWVAFARFIQARHPCAEAILRIGCDRRYSFPFMKVHHRILPDKFKVLGKVLDPSMMPSEISFSMELADFEVI